MPKRPASDVLFQEGAVYKAQPSSSRRDPPIEDEMGEFEDAWEDELESDEDVAEINDENGVFANMLYRMVFQAVQEWMSMRVSLQLMKSVTQNR